MEAEAVKNLPVIVIPDGIDNIVIDNPVSEIQEKVTEFLNKELSVVFSEEQESEANKVVAKLNAAAKALNARALAVYRTKTADIDLWKKEIGVQSERMTAAGVTIKSQFNDAVENRKLTWKDKLVNELNAMFDKNGIDRHTASDIINPLIKKGSFTEKGELAKSARTALMSYVDGLVAVRQRKADRLAMMVTVSTQSGLASPITEKELKYSVEEYSDADFLMAVHDAIQHRKDIEAAAAEAAAAKIEAEKAVEMVEEIEVEVVTDVSPIALESSQIDTSGMVVTSFDIGSGFISSEFPDAIDVIDELDIFEQQDGNNEPEEIYGFADTHPLNLNLTPTPFVSNEWKGMPSEPLTDLDGNLNLNNMKQIGRALRPVGGYVDLCIKQTEPTPASDDDFFGSIAESLEKDDVANDLLAAGANGIKDLPIETYHSIGGLSGSKIRIGVLSPRHIDNISLFSDDTERDAFLIGSAYHDKVLLPELFGQYIEMPEFKTKAECGRTISESKAEFIAENASKVVLPKGALEQVGRMANNTMASFGELIRGQLKECSYGAMIAGVFVKARPDIIITEQVGVFEPGDDIDLKSLSIDVYDDFALKNHFKKCGYYHGAALRNIVRRELGLKVGYNYLLLQRSQGGFENRIIRLLPSEVVAVERDVMESLSEYKLYKDDSATLYSRVATI